MASSACPACLLDTDLDSEQREFAEITRRSAESLLTIINTILDFSKIEAGRLELEFQPFELRDCVESAVDLLSNEASAKGLNLAYIAEGEFPESIIGDVTRLRQVLINLLGNSIKFTEEGEVALTVTSRRKDPAEVPRQMKSGRRVRNTNFISRSGTPASAFPRIAGIDCSSRSVRLMPLPRAGTAVPGSGWPSASGSAS